VAVARFQKRDALNADSFADAATRLKLGVKAGPLPAQPGGGRRPDQLWN
jgi:hypothetical protein